MRYAVPVSGGVMSPHFGHCEHFALIDVAEDSKEITAKELVPSPEHQPGLLPEWLAQQGVSVVIASGMAEYFLAITSGISSTASGSGRCIRSLV